MSSVLESVYVEPTRPYSQNELCEMRNKLFKKLHIGDILATHMKCNHTYYVKKNGKKEQEINEHNNAGNCSVCWKLNKTPKFLKERAKDLIYMYKDTFSNKMSYESNDVETAFYTWLYSEFNNKKE